MKAVAIIGLAERIAGRGSHAETLEEGIFECARAALMDASVGIEEIDGVVTASSDQLDGRAISVMVTSGPVGGVGRDVLNVSSSAEHALVVAAMRAAAGTHRLQLVMSWGRPSEAEPRALDRIASEPFFTRSVSPGAEGLRGAFATRYVQRFGLHEEDVAAFVTLERRRAVDAGSATGSPIEAREVLASPWRAWPLRDLHLPPLADGIVALIVASPEAAEHRARAAWLSGMAWRSGSPWPSDRGYDSAAQSTAVVDLALRRAGRVDHRCDCWEWHFGDPYEAAALVEGLGLADPGGGTAWLSAMPTTHDPSGGAYAGDTVFATGLFRVAAAVRQVTDRAGDAQVLGANSALAHAVSGAGAQSASAFVLES